MRISLRSLRSLIKEELESHLKFDLEFDDNLQQDPLGPVPPDSENPTLILDPFTNGALPHPMGSGPLR